jgi:poly(A) polymerase
MAQAGVLAHTLPGAEARLLPILVALEDVPPDPIRRLAILGGDDVAERLRLSKSDRDRLATLRAGIASATPPGALAYAHGADIAWDIMLLRAASFETAPDPSAKAAIATGATARFPIRPADLMPDLQGPALGTALKALEQDWIASGFTLTRDQLLARPR